MNASNWTVPLAPKSVAMHRQIECKQDPQLHKIRERVAPTLSSDPVISLVGWLAAWAAASGSFFLDEAFRRREAFSFPLHHSHLFSPESARLSRRQDGVFDGRDNHSPRVFRYSSSQVRWTSAPIRFSSYPRTDSPAFRGPGPGLYVRIRPQIAVA